MLNFNMGYDPYAGSHKKQHFLELVMLLRRALTLKALYEKMVSLLTLTFKRLIPNGVIPGLMYYYATRRYAFYARLVALVEQHGLTLQYGYKPAMLGIIALTVIDLLEMTMLGIAIIGQQYIFWRLFIRPRRIGNGNPPRPNPPRRRNIQFP